MPFWSDETEQQKQQRQQRERLQKEQAQWDASILGRVANAGIQATQIVKNVASTPLTYLQNAVQYGKGVSQQAKAAERWGQGDILGAVSNYAKGAWNQSAGSRGMDFSAGALLKYALPAWGAYSGVKWLYNKARGSKPALMYKQRQLINEGKLPKKTILRQIQDQLQDYDQKQAADIRRRINDTALNRISQYTSAQLKNLYDGYADQLSQLARDKLNQGKQYLGRGKTYLNSKRSKPPPAAVVSPGIGSNLQQQTNGITPHQQPERQPEKQKFTQVTGVD